MEGNTWIPVGSGLPEPNRYCFIVSKTTISDIPTCAVGYLKYAAGDNDCPYFVVPGVERIEDLAWQYCPEGWFPIGWFSMEYDVTPKPPAT
jgi:hypothetical protein